MMTAQRLHELIHRFPSLRIMVVGDFFLDKYLEFDPDLAEVSLETGKIANQVVDVRCSPGAAGTVVSNLVALGAGEVIPVGCIGDDGEGYELRAGLVSLGCNPSRLVIRQDVRTPTYLKPRNCRLPGLEGEAERYDTKNRKPLPAEVEDAIIDLVGALLPKVDAVIIADQVQETNCGVITDKVRRALSDMAASYPHVVFWADSRERVGLFRNIITKPNQHEALRAVYGDTDPDQASVVEAGRVLALRSGKPVFLTRGERGILLFDGDDLIEVPTVRIDGPTDPTGAGDSATASAVLTLAGGGTPTEAALMANLVASITVQQLGVTGTATPEDLPDRLELWRHQNIR